MHALAHAARQMPRRSCERRCAPQSHLAPSASPPHCSRICIVPVSYTALALQVRITLEGLDKELLCVNRSLNAIRAEILSQGLSSTTPVRVYVASDTKHGLTRAQALLGHESIISSEGSAVHSTRMKSMGAALKVAVDFLALALADVQFGIGACAALLCIASHPALCATVHVPPTLPGHSPLSGLAPLPHPGLSGL